MNSLPKIIVIVGPTASGKTDLGILLAKKFNGEIVSADSRQVYKKMSVGTGKPPGEWVKVDDREVYLVEGVAHYLMDVYDPSEEISLAEYKARAEEHIANILGRGKLPIIVGGTGLYVWSIVDNLDMPKVAPNKELRQSLEKKTLAEMVKQLEEIDPESLEHIDTKNHRRVIRALEVAILTGKSFHKQRSVLPPLYNALQIGILWKIDELYQNIFRRIDSQIEQGLVDETAALVSKKYDWNLPSMSSIGYRQIGGFLRGVCDLSQAVAEIKHETRNYAKRQMTWFKRDKRIMWVEHKQIEKASEIVKIFLEA